MPKSVATTLKEALGIIDTRGWTRGWMVKPKTGECCSLGAIGIARGYIPKDHRLFDDTEFDSFIDEASDKLAEDPAVQYLFDVINEVYPESYLCTCDTCTVIDGVVGWNDSEDEASVRTVWLAAIEKAETQGV